jgi:[acyl-carrier-protein] S-malonyltransferase
MLESWLTLEPFAQAIAHYSEVTGLDLAALGTTGDADQIRDTSIAQPLLVATALASATVLGVGTAVSPAVFAGHSVGEFGAAALAGVISHDDALRLVTARGAAMAQAAAQSEPTSMAAVLGGEPEDVADSLEKYGLTPANVNGGGQVVAAGAKVGIEALVANPPERARVIELQVAGAFHTDYMSPAVETLRHVANATPASDPHAILLSNADGASVTSGPDAVDRLVRQVANPVRWDLCMDAMQSLGVTGIIELAPGGVLVGLAKRVLKGVPAVALKSPADIDAALSLAQEAA